MEIGKWAIMGVVLLIQSILDIHIRRIPTSVTLFAGFAGVYFSIVGGRNIQEVMLAILPGALCLLIGWATKEAIGYGDGILITVMGLYFSFEQLLGICMIAFILAGITALVLFVFFAGKAKDELPFVPFLLAGGILSCVW